MQKELKTLRKFSMEIELSLLNLSFIPFSLNFLVSVDLFVGILFQINFSFCGFLPCSLVDWFLNCLTYVTAGFQINYPIRMELQLNFIEDFLVFFNSRRYLRLIGFIFLMDFYYSDKSVLVYGRF